MTVLCCSFSVLFFLSFSSPLLHLHGLLDELLEPAHLPSFRQLPVQLVGVLPRLPHLFFVLVELVANLEVVLPSLTQGRKKESEERRAKREDQTEEKGRWRDKSEMKERREIKVNSDRDRQRGTPKRRR